MAAEEEKPRVLELNSREKKNSYERMMEGSRGIERELEVFVRGPYLKNSIRIRNLV